MDMTVDPASLRIQLYPAEVLRRKARPIEPGPEAQAVGRRMLELMRGADAALTSVPAGKAALEAEAARLGTPPPALPWAKTSS